MQFHKKKFFFVKNDFEKKRKTIALVLYFLCHAILYQQNRKIIELRKKYFVVNK